MSDHDAHPDVKRVIADAVEDARDGPLDPQRLESVRQLLLTSTAARRYYLECNELSHLLTSEHAWPAYHRGEIVVKARGARRRFLPAAIVLAAAVAAVAIALTVALQHGERSGVIASLQDINGNVAVTAADAETRPVEAKVNLQSGDTIRTHGALSSAVLTYPDGTRLMLVGTTSVSITCSSDGQKSVVVHGGTLFASVAPQLAGRPMLVATPHNQVEVLGTKFSLEASARETDVSVSEGRVRLTRLSDGRSVEVPAGQRVVSREQSELALQQIPTPPVEWSEDFEDGLPADWETGKFVTDDLPVGSKGAVQAARLLYGGHVLFNIDTHSDWPYGLFTAHQDSHLHFTFKMAKPDWIDIIICTRTTDGDPPAFSSNYIFKEPGWWPDEPGRWGTVSIPLAKFRRAAWDAVPIERVVPFKIVFSSPEGDRGLVIDRMWVTRGGPGTVESKLVPQTERTE